MPQANRETVIAYLHRMYGMRPDKVKLLLEEPEINDYLLLGQLDDAFDYTVAEQVMTAVNDRIPADTSAEYHDWIDAEWVPTEAALLEMSQLEEVVAVDEEDDTNSGNEDDSEVIDEEFEVDEEEEVEEEEEDDDDWEDDDEDEDDDEEDDSEDEEGEALVSNQKFSGPADQVLTVSTGNFEGLRQRWDALRAAHLGYDTRLNQDSH